MTNLTDLKLPIEGMTCASCVARVERALKAVPGVADVSVNLATEQAQLRVEAGARTEAIAAAVERAGYTVAHGTTDLAVDGMTCASCVARVERALEAVPGVLDASVNLATGRATIDHAGVDATALMAAVQRAGYEAQPVTAAAAPARPRPG